MNRITQHFSQLDEALTLVDVDEIQKAIDVIREVKRSGGTVWMAGNGGSAATASHFANDLSKMGRVRAISVSDMTPITLAYGNDDGWEKMFSYFLSDYLSDNDTVVGISCSGNSANIISFMAVSRNCPRIVLTGPGVNTMSEMDNEVLIRGMSDEITVIEDVHSVVCHAIARALRDE